MINRAKAEALVIMMGSNDLLQCPSLAADVCAERMELFLGAILAETKTSKLLLIAPPPMKPGTWVNNPRTLEESRRLADCYETVAQRLRIAFADAGSWNVALAYDGLHFSEEGHRTFTKGIKTALDGLFPEKQ